MPTVLVATKPYQGQLIIDGEWYQGPVWIKTRKKSIKVATQGTLQGCLFESWELDGVSCSTANPAIIELPKTDCEIYANFKKE